MTRKELQTTLRPEDATQAWAVLAEQVESLVTAWQAWNPGDTVPLVANHLPTAPEALWRLALVELIKVDLEYRWRDQRLPRQVEEYVAEFPDLDEGLGPPADLIYEEYHVRRQAGDNVEIDDYFRRFPGRSKELGALLGLEAPHNTTTLVNTTKAPELDVGATIDDFTLLARLGQGAFGAVYQARQVSMQRIVALKVTSDQGSEPQTMAQLDHPNIVRVYDQRVLPQKRQRLLYMQYVAGGTLQGAIEQARQPGERTGRTLLASVDKSLEARGESPPAESTTRHRLAAATWPEAVCWMGARLANALAYADSKGVLHRDVKPANVLLTAEGSPKLADFNISYGSSLEGATAAAYFGGSLAYMSPEQIEACNPGHARQADSLDGRSDVYSLGVVLWEMLTGHRPFDDVMSPHGYAATLQEMCQRRHEGVPFDAHVRVPPNCPPGLVDVLVTALAPRVEDRYASAAVFARQLELCLQPRAQRLLRTHGGGWRAWARRHSITALILAGVASSLIATPLNIWYNKVAIIDREDSGFDVDFFKFVQIPAVNLTLYPLGIALVLWLCWPVLQGLARVRRGEKLTPREQDALPGQTLRFGDFVARISFSLWLMAGVIFPCWQWLIGQSLQPTHLAHFVMSQFLCGMLVATLGFFCMSLMSVRIVFPQLWNPGSADERDAHGLARLSRRTDIYQLLTFVTPLLAFGMLPVLDDTELRIVFAAIAVVAGVAVLAAYLLRREIQSDIEALRIAAAPSSEGIGLGSTTAETFRRSGFPA